MKSLTFSKQTIDDKEVYVAEISAEGAVRVHVERAEEQKSFQVYTRLSSTQRWVRQAVKWGPKDLEFGFQTLVPVQVQFRSLCAVEKCEYDMAEIPGGGGGGGDIQFFGDDDIQDIINSI